MDFVQELRGLRITDPDRYEDFVENYTEVGAAIVEIDRVDCKPTVVASALRYNGDSIELLDKPPRVGLESVRDVMRSLEEMDALKEYRSFTNPRYSTERFDEDTYENVLDSINELEYRSALNTTLADMDKFEEREDYNRERAERDRSRWR